MQIVLLEKDDINAKLKSRKLYESCFDDGKDYFIDYYYDEIIKRNEMIVAKDGDEIVSMIHLNPYQYNICGDIRQVHYLVAISTREDYRGQGLMSQCIKKAIDYLNSLKEPFCYLVPDTTELEITYAKYGFEKVDRFNIDKFSKEKYDIYPHNSDEYVQLMKKEDYFLTFETEEYKNDLKEKSVMLKVLDNCDYKIDFFKEKKIYVCQEV